MLIPPDNFGLVEPGVYRCSKLEADHLPFLETLQLKSLILLDVAKPPRTLKSFLSENKVDLYNLGGLKISNHRNTGTPTIEPSSPLYDAQLDTSQSESRSGDIEVVLEREKSSKNDSWMLIEKNLILAALEILLDRTKHRVLLVDSSSAMVGILRKIQKWNFNSIVNEYRIYTGNSSKSSYNVEVFLELLQLELIPYELDHALRKREELNSEHSSSRPSLSTSRMASMSGSANQGTRSSIDEGAITGEEEDTFSVDDYEDDMDDDLLSASPQIPANLLKLVEQRKKSDGVSPGTSPDFRRGSGGMTERCNSSDTVYKMATRHRRKSSVESRYLLSNNNRFRDPQSLTSNSPRRPSLDASLHLYRLEREKSSGEEIQRIKEKLSYRYYQPQEQSTDRFNVIKLRIPPEHKLAEWFTRGRNFWEKTVEEKEKS